MEKNIEITKPKVKFTNAHGERWLRNIEKVTIYPSGIVKLEQKKMTTYNHLSNLVIIENIPEE